MSEQGAIETLESAFGSTDLYAILGVERGATGSSIKKAYYRSALQWVRCPQHLGVDAPVRPIHAHREQHPDKNAGDDAKIKFQALSLAYKVLSDAKRRAEYDESGELDLDDSEINADWFAYWRTLFPAVTTAAIDHFAAKYRGGDEERTDVERAYVEHGGDMGKVLDVVMLSTEADLDRFADMVHDAIATGRVPAFEAFTKVHGSFKEDPARKKRARKPSQTRKRDGVVLDGGDRGRRRRGGGDDDEAAVGSVSSLEAAIMARNRGRQMDSMLDALAAKYGGGKTKAKGTGGGRRRK